MRWPALFAYGFRPFFLGAALAALVLVPWWAASFAFGVPLANGWAPTLWHAHEMLYGFIGAAIAGFLLTAVPSWTGRRGYAGAPLAALAVLWLAGRILIATAASWPAVLVAAVDLAFLPLLALLLAPPLLRERNRNAPLLVVLATLWLANVIFHVQLGRLDASRALAALRVGIDVVLVLVTVIGGRIVPAFTASGLRASGAEAPLHAWRGITPVVVALMLLVTVVDAWRPDGRMAAMLALAVALAQAVRLAQWRSPNTVGVPLVWVLHLGYAWLVVGFALKALALLAGAAAGAFWLHALTVGAASTMIVAVMTRATLGHTGRPLVAPAGATVGYALLTAAAVVRVFGLLWWPSSYPAVIVLAALLWTGAFAWFAAVYGPMLLAPRADGRPG
ncbi:MAG: NnrS family protein [Proteobacteria bacterium]|nr:NnrS family protein [Pseudomonadota bacterium]